MLVRVGISCLIFSRICKYDGQDPGPLRDDQHLYRLAFPNKKDRVKLYNEKILFIFLMRLLRVYDNYQILYIDENSLYKILWEISPLQRFACVHLLNNLDHWALGLS